MLANCQNCRGETTFNQNEVIDMQRSVIKKSCRLYSAKSLECSLTDLQRMSNSLSTQLRLGLSHRKTIQRRFLGYVGARARHTMTAFR